MIIQEDDLRKNIEDKLNWDTRIDSSNIEIDVNDEGLVQIQGKVPSFSMKKIVSEDIRELSGVSKVKNDLTVEYTATVELKDQPTDAEIKKNVKIALELNASIDATKIEVEVYSKIVKLRGTVNSFWKKEIAENVTSEVKGVTDVINEINIIPTENIFDKMIAKNITSILERFYNVNPDNLDIFVKDGKVRVSGRVNDWAAYDVTMKAVKYTSGVKDIEDDIIIKSL